MWNLAIKTLLADRGKLATAMVGVVFSIVLVNVQGGLFVGLLRKASLLVDLGNADVWIGHRRMHNVDFPRDIPERWIDRVRSLPDVAAVEPYVIGHGNMTLPSGGFEMVVVVGCDKASLMGNAWNGSASQPEAVRATDGILVDCYETAKLEFPRIGDVREIGGRRARIVGQTQGIVGFLVTPYVFTTLDRASGYLDKPDGVCSYYLARLAPGADAQTVCERIRARVPELDAYPRDEYAWRSVHYWLTRTGLGISFGAATALGLLVGLIMVAQTLYASVLDRLGEFGALKAMGATEGQILRVLLLQALSMAVAGSVLGLLVVLGVQAVFSSPHAPIVVPAWLSLGSCLLVLSICLCSALLPYWRVRRVDPLMVLQG